jgi:hypothetical protein
MPNKTRCEQRSGGLTITLVFSHPAPGALWPRDRLRHYMALAHGLLSKKAEIQIPEEDT